MGPFPLYNAGSLSPSPWWYADLHQDGEQEEQEKEKTRKKRQLVRTKLPKVQKPYTIKFSYNHQLIKYNESKSSKIKI